MHPTYCLKAAHIFVASENSISETKVILYLGQHHHNHHRDHHHDYQHDHATTTPHYNDHHITRTTVCAGRSGSWAKMARVKVKIQCILFICIIWFFEAKYSLFRKTWSNYLFLFCVFCLLYFLFCGCFGRSFNCCWGAINARSRGPHRSSSVLGAPSPIFYYSIYIITHSVGISWLASSSLIVVIIKNSASLHQISPQSSHSAIRVFHRWHSFPATGRQPSKPPPPMD